MNIQVKEMKFVVIDGFPNYAVSSNGIVKNLKTGRILKPFHVSGYLAVTLCKDGKKNPRHIHRLVALAFLPKPNCDSKCVVDHINGDRTDNRFENLRFVSYGENSRNKLSHAGVKYDFVEEIPSGSLHLITVRGEDCSEVGLYYDKESDEFLLKMAPGRYRIMKKHPLANGYRIYFNLNGRFIYYSSYQIRQEYPEYFAE